MKIIKKINYIKKMIIKNMIKQYFKKVLNFFIIKDYYDGILVEYNSIKDNIYQIEQFQNDKLICTKEKQILIYNLLEEKLILKEDVPSDIQDCKIKVLRNDLICFYKKERFSFTINYILFFEYKENKTKNEYSLKMKAKIPEAANDILLYNKKILCFKNKCLNIYNSLNNEKYELQIIINLPNSTTNYKGIIQNHKDKNIGIFGYKKGENIIFLILNKNFLKLSNHSIKNTSLFDDDIYYPDLIKIKLYNNNIIMFIGNIYLLSFEGNELKILKKIYCTGYIDNIHMTKNGELYAYGKDFVYKLDNDTKSFYKVSLEIKGNIKSMGILENKKKVFILKTRDENTKLCQLCKYNILRHYINYYIKLIFYLFSFRALALGNWKLNISFSYIFKTVIFYWVLLKIGWGFKGNWIIGLIIIIFILRFLFKFSLKIVTDIYDFIYSLFKGSIDFVKSIREYKFKKLNINFIIKHLIENIIEFSILLFALSRNKWRFKGTWILITIIIILIILSLLKFSMKLMNYLSTFAYSLFKELIDFINSLYNFCQGILQIINIVI